MTELEKRTKKEVRKLKKLIEECGISEVRRKALEPLIDNVAFMKIKLDDTKAEIEDASVVVDYDNGGGQRGKRENPLFVAYEKLWRSYISGLGKILEVIPAEKAAEIDASVQSQSVLELVKCQKGA